MQVATWAIGDVQGCLSSLTQLLSKIAFRPEGDELWLVGDLVGRGPDPCGVLDLLISLEERAVCVLGNHDLHLIAASFASSGPPEVHFGLGEHERVDEVTIRWPDGALSELGPVDTRQLITVTRQ